MTTIDAHHNPEAMQRYSTAKEYVETIKLVQTSPHYIGQHVMMAIRPTHLLVGFALELYLKAWLLADGATPKKVRSLGHKLRDAFELAVARGLAEDNDIYLLVDHVAEPHGQDHDYVYRYSKVGSKIEPLNWDKAYPILHKLDEIVDAHVGASEHFGLKPGH